MFCFQMKQSRNFSFCCFYGPQAIRKTKYIYIHTHIYTYTYLHLYIHTYIGLTFLKQTLKTYSAQYIFKLNLQFLSFEILIKILMVEKSIMRLSAEAFNIPFSSNRIIKIPPTFIRWYYFLGKSECTFIEL